VTEVRYTRDVPFEVSEAAYLETIAHVRSHLSSVASLTDDPNLYMEMVTITESLSPEGQRRITGELAAEPVASYANNGFFDPDENRTYAFDPDDRAVEK
jgi:hypothetical protein